MWDEITYYTCSQTSMGQPSNGFVIKSHTLDYLSMTRLKLIHMSVKVLKKSVRYVDNDYVVLIYIWYNTSAFVAHSLFVILVYQYILN